jgi:hypothetical protein
MTDPRKLRKDGLIIPPDSGEQPPSNYAISPLSMVALPFLISGCNSYLLLLGILKI